MVEIPGQIPFKSPTNYIAKKRKINAEIWTIVALAVKLSQVTEFSFRNFGILPFRSFVLSNYYLFPLTFSPSRSDTNEITSAE